jgi:ectoine hydroxylase-related dioxygenase (phytanoyl-CoA dioxygenase family)
VQDWHTDGPPARVRAGVCKPYACCVFVPLQDLESDPAMGCTQFWPGSHLCPHLLGFGPAASELHSTLDALVRAGDAVLYDYRTMHRGLPNNSDLQREMLQIVYHDAAYAETRNYAGASMYGQGTVTQLA